MRRTALITLAAVGLLVAVSVALAQQSNELATGFARLRVLRAEADEDAALIDLTTAGNFASMPSLSLIHI